MCMRGDGRGRGGCGFRIVYFPFLDIYLFLYLNVEQTELNVSTGILVEICLFFRFFVVKFGVSGNFWNF